MMLFLGCRNHAPVSIPVFGIVSQEVVSRFDGEVEEQKMSQAVKMALCNPSVCFPY